MEARLTPRALAIAATVYCPEQYISWATWSLCPVSTDGRPPRRPRARAAASPALVRSRMRSRSNSANAANTWKTSLPPGVVVSMASWRLRNPTPHSARPVTVVDQMPQGAAEPVELPDDQGVTGAQLVQDLLEDRSVAAGAAGGLDKHPVAARRREASTWS